MIKHSNDLELVKSLQVGDENAIAQIYDLYWRKLLSIAYNHTKDKSASQEIVQEILIKLWDRRADVQIDSLANYLAGAVKYAVLNYTLREKRRSAIAYQAIENMGYELDEEKIYAQFLQEYINGVVDQLPEKCKLVFQASRESGKTNREIAAELDISEKTVEAHLTKALKSIKLSLRSTGLFSLLLSVYLIK